MSFQIWRTPRHLFNTGSFKLHSGDESDWEIDCRALQWGDWLWAAREVATRVQFGSVEGVPTGGLAFARALEPYCTVGPLLIVDDMMTTGQSMEELRAGRSPCVGYVLFDRTGLTSDWIKALWRFVD